MAEPRSTFLGRALSGARKIRPRTNAPVTGKFYSRKMSGLIPWESSYERDFCLICEFDRRVSAYFPQPETFKLTLDGKDSSYTPDFAVHHADYTNPVFIEVKPARFSHSTRLVAITDYMARQGKVYFVFTEDQLHSAADAKGLLSKYSRGESHNTEFVFW